MATPQGSKIRSRDGITGNVIDQREKSVRVYCLENCNNPTMINRTVTIPREEIIDVYP